MERIKSVFKNNLRQSGMITTLIGIMLLFQFLTQGTLLKPINITNLILQNSYILILAIGMLLVILTGNIDLSVGSTAAFIGAVSATLIITMHVPVIIAIPICLILGGLVGAWQGYWVAYAKIPAFIVTLAGMLIFRGLNLVMLKGRTLAPFPDAYQAIGSGFIPDILNGDKIHLTSIVVGIVFSLIYIFIAIRDRKNKLNYNFEVESKTMFLFKTGILVIIINIFTYWLAIYKGLPTVLVLLMVLIVAYTFVTKKTIPGRHIYALGGNEKAARLSGVKTDKVMFGVYVNMGVLAALGGIVFAGRLNAATPTAGNLFELDAIAACYIGGASATGGIGTIFGTIIGGLVMGVLNNGMSIMGVSVDWQQTIKGLVLLLAVALDMYTKNKGKITA